MPAFDRQKYHNILAKSLIALQGSWIHTPLVFVRHLKYSRKTEIDFLAVIRLARDLADQQFYEECLEVIGQITGALSVYLDRDIRGVRTDSHGNQTLHISEKDVVDGETGNDFEVEINNTSIELPKLTWKEAHNALMQIQMLRSECYTQMGQFANSRLALEQANTNAATPKQQILLFLERSRLAVHRGEFEEALTCAQCASGIYIALADDEKKREYDLFGQCELRAAEAWLAVGSYSMAKKKYRVLTRYSGKDSGFYQATGYFGLGLVQFYTGNHVKAKDYFKVANNATTWLGNHSLLYTINRFLGVVEVMSGDPEAGEAWLARYLVVTRARRLNVETMRYILTMLDLSLMQGDVKGFNAHAKALREHFPHPYFEGELEIRYARFHMQHRLVEMDVVKIRDVDQLLEGLDDDEDVNPLALRSNLPDIKSFAEVVRCLDRAQTVFTAGHMMAKGLTTLIMQAKFLAITVKNLRAKTVLLSKKVKGSKGKEINSALQAEEGEGAAVFRDTATHVTLPKERENETFEHDLEAAKKDQEEDEKKRARTNSSRARGYAMPPTSDRPTVVSSKSTNIDDADRTRIRLGEYLLIMQKAEASLLALNIILRFKLEAIIAQARGKRGVVMNQKRQFSGHVLVEWLTSNNFCRTRDDGILLGSTLVDVGVIINVMKRSSERYKMFTGSNKHLWMFQEDAGSESFEKRLVLNERVKFTGMVSDPETVAAKVRAQIQSIFGRYIGARGKEVDYLELRYSDDFHAYEEAVMQLQAVDLSSLSEDERRAFFMNIYNALVIHATIVLGPPKGILAKVKFFTKAGYNIGGVVFSANDIEHGILRANRKCPGLLSPQFKRESPKLAYSCSLDPRIHFAISCGARSCPAIRVYNAENMDRDLDQSADNFLSAETSIVQTKTGPVIYLSKILSWFARDFGDNDAEVIRYIASKIKSNVELKLNLLALVDHGAFKIKYARYDWDTNAAMHMSDKSLVGGDDMV